MNNYRDKRAEGFSSNRGGGKFRSYNRNEDSNGRQKPGQRFNKFGEGRPSYGGNDYKGGREEGGNRFKFNNRNDREANNNRYVYDRNNAGRFDNEQGQGGYRRPRFRQAEGEQGGNRPYSNTHNAGAPRGERYNGHGGDRKPAYAQRTKNGVYNANSKYNKKKQIQYKEVLADPDAPLRLNKYLANAHVARPITLFRQVL